MKEDIFEQIDSNNKAYWLGFLAADGSIKGSELSIGLASKDREHLVKFLKFINSDNSIIDTMSHCTNNDKYYPSSHINLHSTKLVEDLKKYGIVSNKSYQSINFLENVPKEYLASFVIGYFDGDGWFVCTEKNHGFGFCGNKETITAIRDFLLEIVEFNLSISQYNKSKRTFYFQSSSKIRLKIFVDFYLSFENDCDLLERKKNTANTLKFLLDGVELIKVPKKPPLKICECCGIEYYPSYKDQKYCSYACSSKSQQRVERPSREELKLMIRTTPFLQLSKKYGVSDNAIRKWCDRYNLPRKVSDIKKLTDEEWNKV